MPPIPLLTIGKIADELSQPVTRVAYILKTRRHIQPSAVAGVTRLFDRQALAQIRHEVNAIDAKTDRESTQC